MTNNLCINFLLLKNKYYELSMYVKNLHFAIFFLTIVELVQTRTSAQLITAAVASCVVTKMAGTAVPVTMVINS